MGLVPFKMADWHPFLICVIMYCMWTICDTTRAASRGVTYSECRRK